MKKIAKIITVMLCVIGIATMSGCKKDEEKQSTSGSTPIQTNSGEIKITNQSLKNSYQITYSGPKNGSTIILPGRQQNTVVPIGYYQFSIEQKTGYIDGHKLEYSGQGSVSSNSPLNITIPKLGTLIIKNLTSDPDSVSINNGVYSFTLQGGYQQTLSNCDEGYYKIYVKQISGYTFYPTEDTYYGTLQGGGSLTTNIND